MWWSNIKPDLIPANCFILSSGREKQEATSDLASTLLKAYCSQQGFSPDLPTIEFYSFILTGSDLVN
jgi:hypothetical protein